MVAVAAVAAAVEAAAVVAAAPAVAAVVAARRIREELDGNQRSMVVMTTRIPKSATS